MPEPNSQPQLPTELPQAYKDQVLHLVKSAVTDSAADVIEAQFKRFEEIATKRLEEVQKAAIGERALTEIGKGKSVLGALGYAVLKAGRARKSGASATVAEEFAKAIGVDVAKSINLQDATAGGILVQGDVANFFFDVLRPRVAVLSLGPQEVPMPSRSLKITGFTGDATSTFVGEPNTQEVKSEPTTGARLLSAKTQMTLVPISNQMLDVPAGPQVTRFIEGNTVRRVAITQDEKAIRGSGTAYTPKGLTGWGAATNANGTVNLTNILADLGKQLNRMEESNVPCTKLGYIFAPRTKNYLMFAALDGDTRPFFMDEMKGGTLLGVPFRATSSVPTNLGSGDKSEVILADFDMVLYGSVGGPQIEYFAEGSYTENGVLVSAMERNEQVLRVVLEWDLNVEHTQAVDVLDAVAWKFS
jgi:HK97 family phage major capsid protein